MFNRLKNAEWSKKLLVFVEVLILLTFCLVAAAVIAGDASPLTAFITGVFSLASIAFGFYYWKARSENIRKYAKNVTAEDIEKLDKLYQKIFGGENDIQRN